MVRPVPSPSSTRPLEIWSRVRTCRASMAGLRRGIWVTAVVRRTVSVAWAMAASAVQASYQGAEARLSDLGGAVKQLGPGGCWDDQHMEADGNWHGGIIERGGQRGRSRV